MRMPFVDLQAQYRALRPEIDERIQRVLDHAQFILGPEVAELERALGEYTNSRFAISVSSGTDALIMALLALGVGPGDEVITTCYSWISTAEAVRLVGARPVFVDVESDTFNIDCAQVECAITSRTKVIMPVSLFGQPADMDALNDIARRHSLRVVEDAAQSFGGEYDGRKSCALSIIGCTSFFPAKPLGCYGDGGAVFTDEEHLASAMLSIRIHGEEVKHLHSRVGINGRLDTLQAAILLPKLKRLPWELEQRRLLARRYNDAFAAYSDRIKTPIVRPNRESAWAQYTLLVDDREAFQKGLAERGVPTAVYYPRPMHLQPAYIEAGGPPSLPVAERLASQAVSLPIYPDMDSSTQEYIVQAVREVLER